MILRSFVLALAFSAAQFLNGATAFAAPAIDRGTLDGAGGGNGTAGRAYESYIKDPRKLPAYVEFLKPLFDKIDAELEAQEHASKSASGSDSGVFKFSDYFAAKTWYFVPATLPTLDANSIGVGFTQHETQQLALQFDRTIWIDTQLFDVMSREDQATLILHEFVMEIFFVRFKGVKALLEFTQRIRPYQPQFPGRTLEFAEMMYPGETPRALNENDYDQIRTMTAWLLREGMSSNLKDIWSRFKQRGFDQRLFNLNNGNGGETIKITKKDVLSALRRAQAARRLPSVLSTPSGESLGAGRMVFSEMSAPFMNSGADLPMIRLQFFGPNDQTVADEKLFLSDGPNEAGLVVDFGTGRSLAMIIGGFIFSPGEIRVGDVRHNVMMYFRIPTEPGRPPIELDSIVLKPVVIVETDREGDNPCLAEDFDRGSALTERMVVFTSPQSTITKFHRLMPTMVDGQATCGIVVRRSELKP